MQLAADASGGQAILCERSKRLNWKCKLISMKRLVASGNGRLPKDSETRAGQEWDALLPPDVYSPTLLNGGSVFGCVHVLRPFIDGGNYQRAPRTVAIDRIPS